MKRVVVVLVLAVGIVGGLAYIFRDRLIVAIRYEPIVAMQATAGTQALPDGSVVIASSDIADLTAPIVRRRDLAGAGRHVIELPEGAGDATSNGVARFELQVPEPGTYEVWMRTRWNDECANSCRLQVAGAPETIVGQDAVYGKWHWVRAGRHELNDGAVDVVLAGREDGIAIDQLLFTPDPAYLPRGRIGDGTTEMDVRRFADNFNRSPGHGLAAWQLISGNWSIRFDLDPNRVPLQYALRGAATSSGRPAQLRAGSEPWEGLLFETHIYMPADSEAGVVLTDGADDTITIALSSEKDITALVVTRRSAEESRVLPEPLPSNQWYRLVVERWAGLLLVSLDDRRIYSHFDLAPAAVHAGLYVRRGDPTFDDVRITEILWTADDAASRGIAWQPSSDAAWYRPRKKDDALYGRRGSISAPAVGLKPLACWIQETGTTATHVLPAAESDAALPAGRLIRFDRRAPAAMPVSLNVTSATRVRSVAIAYTHRDQDVLRLGPYHFTRNTAEDPSDYLDFTAEELHAIRTSPEADKLKRKPRIRHVVGRDETAFWITKSGQWRIQDGVLHGIGPGAELHHWQDVISDMTISFRARLNDVATRGSVTVYGDSRDEVEIVFGSSSAAADRSTEPVIPIAADDAWHTVRVRVDTDGVRATVDGKRVYRETGLVDRGHGGRIGLRVAQGTVQLDDVVIEVPRRGSAGRLYAFDRRECDWYRDGPEWIDHAGIACVLASNWISLASPNGAGYLWNKLRFGPNVILAFSVEEYSSWYGWNANPSHAHYPYDNISAVLGTAHDADSGYRLVVNAENRKQTLLYRDGKLVAQRAQDASFPVKYHGGHGPYQPRRIRIALAKDGATIYAYVEGKQVLTYTDPDPINVETVGLGGHATRANFSYVAVRSL